MDLNSEEAAQLQAEINSTLANTVGGTQVSQYEIAWDGGAVQMSFPAPGSKVTPPTSQAALALPNTPENDDPGLADSGYQAVNDCPASWYCFWQDADYSGRMLKWSYRYCNNEFPNKAKYINFTDYDFNDKASSWRNKTPTNPSPSYIYVYDHTNAQGALLWQEEPGGRSNYVGNDKNDRASSFKACERSP